MPIPDHGDASELTRAAIEELYQKMERPMFNVVVRRLWDPHEAQDVVQEAFLQLWRHRRALRRETVAAWLCRSALNLASNRRRFARLRRWTGIREAAHVQASSGRDDLEVRQDEQRVRAAIDALPEKLRRVLLLTEFAELSHAEVAGTLGIPVGTVASRRHLALGRLEALLGEA
jgi:RNA polymerase sigma factor (sigma-70 family)